MTSGPLNGQINQRLTMNLRPTILALAILTFSQQLFAQENSDNVQIFRAHDAVVALGVAALAAATMSVDESIARSLQRSSAQSNGFLRGTTNVFSNLGFPGSAIMTAGAYFLGLEKHSRPIAALGMHTGEAIVLGGVLAEGLQMTIGRSRPQRDITAPRDFRFAKGFSNDDYTSLPSAHVTSIRGRDSGESRGKSLLAGCHQVCHADQLRGGDAGRRFPHVQEQALGERCRHGGWAWHLLRSVVRPLQPRPPGQCVRENLFAEVNRSRA